MGRSRRIKDPHHAGTLTQAAERIVQVTGVQENRSVLLLPFLFIKELVALNGGWVLGVSQPSHGDGSAVQGFQMQLRRLRG